VLRFRRDLRLGDNPALLAARDACGYAERIIDHAAEREQALARYERVRR
jgi:deoxyribodipyrimidine photolyase